MPIMHSCLYACYSSSQSLFSFPLLFPLSLQHFILVFIQQQETLLCFQSSFSHYGHFKLYFQQCVLPQLTRGVSYCTFTIRMAQDNFCIHISICIFFPVLFCIFPFLSRHFPPVLIQQRGAPLIFPVLHVSRHYLASLRKTNSHHVSSFPPFFTPSATHRFLAPSSSIQQG